MPLMKRRFIFEADDDNQEGANGTQNQVQSTANNGENTADNNADADDNNNTDDQNSNDDTNNDQNDNEDTDDDQNNDEDNNDENEDDDYSIDAEPDEDEDNDDNSDDNSDDSDDSSSEEDTSDNDQDSEEKQMDRDMFSTLSEDEQKRKIATLKRLFIDLYSKADGLIEKFNTIEDEDDDTNDEFMPIIKRILTILYDMKEYTSYYVLNVFDKNSYIENDITFNRYLSVLNGIKLITDELEKERNKDDKDKKK